MFGNYKDFREILGDQLKTFELAGKGCILQKCSIVFKNGKEFEVLVRLQEHFRARACEHEEKKGQLFKSGLIGEKRNDMDKTNIE